MAGNFHSAKTHKREAADGPCVASMTSLSRPVRMNELSDGVIRPFNATREERRGPTSEIPVCSESSADFGRQRGLLSWFYWDDPPGDVELVRIPSVPSVECSAGSGISGSPVARGPG